MSEWVAEWVAGGQASRRDGQDGVCVTGLSWGVRIYYAVLFQNCIVACLYNVLLYSRLISYRATATSNSIVACLYITLSYC